MTSSRPSDPPVPYHLASYGSRGENAAAGRHTGRAGAVVGDTVHDVARLTGEPAWATVADVLEDWDRAHPAIEAAVGSPAGSAAGAPGGQGTPLGDVRLLAPVTRPGAVYCIGSNYRDHAEEMRIAGNRPPAPDPRSLGLAPFFFLKSSHAVAGPGVDVHLSGYTTQPDWEIELVAVVGRTARDLAVEDALDCVAGWTIGNDLSARDLKARDGLPPTSLFRADWLRHKSFDDSAPTGPWITPAAYVEDPADLPMRLWVDDELKQDSSSSQMIFTAAEQIAHLSAGMTLHPGDLVMTGTPAGVGAGRGEYLTPGATVTMEIGTIGRMSFTVS